MTKKLIVQGGGGLDSENPLIELYTLAQTNKSNPKICFLPTASGDSFGYIEYFYKLFSNFPCDANHLSLFKPETSDIEDFILSMDAIFVGGGNSKVMLGIWKEFGLDKILKKAYDNGVVLSGGSAGSVCWFKECITDSFPGALRVMNCLGFLPYSNCPHFRSNERKKSYMQKLMTGEISSGYANDDYAALHFENDKLLRVVSSIDDSTCYHFKTKNNSFDMKRLDAIDLRDNDNFNKYIWNSVTFRSSYNETPVDEEVLSDNDIIAVEEVTNVIR